MKTKKSILLLLFLSLLSFVHAQVLKTINVTTPGTLSTLLTANELSTVTDLTVTGNIDARDFKTMRDNMPNLFNLNLEQTNILQYEGTGGSSWYNTSITYLTNEVPEAAFSFKQSLKSIIMPIGTKTIAKNAFSNCIGLVGNLKLPLLLERIGHEAFYGCKSLSGSLAIPSNVKIIEYSAFEECTGFNGSLSFQGNILDTIESNVFSKCNGLTGPLSLPNNLKVIGMYAFLNCNGLNGELYLPSTLLRIGFGAFSGCFKLKGSIIIPTGITSIEDRTFEHCTSLDGLLSIPSTVKTIGFSAFSGCSSLHGNLHIPSSVKKIDMGAFNGCSGFDGTLILSDSIDEIDIFTFANCSHLSGSLVIPSRVWHIAEGAFAGCSRFTGSLNFPPSVYRINSNAFEGCSGFNGNLNLGSVREIYDYAFKDCSGFTGSLNLSSIYRIEKHTFDGCKGFNGNLTFGKIVEYIQEYAFNGCSGFKGDLVIPEFALPSSFIGSYAFSGCSGFNGQLKLSSSITEIKDHAFFGCTGFIGSLILPKNQYKYYYSDYANYYKIGDYAFSGCKGFNGKLILPNQDNTVLGNYAFADCSELVDSLAIPLGVTSIGNYTFSNCSGLNGSLTIPSTVSSIGSGSFMNCIGLNGGLTIPASITSIDSNAFANCINIKRIYAYGKNPSNITLGTSIFEGIPKTTCYLSVPITSKSLYTVANQWKDFINISEGLPVSVTTGNIISRYSTTPTGNGNITNLDINDPTQYGVVWSTIQNPTIELPTKTVQGLASTTGPFTYSLSGLSPNTNYFVKAYATNSTGTSYGEQISFKSPSPVIILNSVNTLSGFKTTKGIASSVQTFTISGFDLASDLVITAPAGFEIQEFGANSFVPTMTFTPVSGVVSNITIAVRIAASAQFTGLISANVLCSTAWSTNKIIEISGEISKKQLTISNSIIVTNKMFDGNPNAIIRTIGTLQGIDAVDKGNIGVTATATYDNASVGTGKTITVVYTLTGSAKDNYIAPINYVINNAKISDYITLSPVSIPEPICEGSSLVLPYTLLTGTPTKYKITFNTAALNAGLNNINYQNLSYSNSNGILTFSIPNDMKDGVYQGVLKMINELNIESPDYPFIFNVNVSENYIHTKFNDVIIFDNSEKRFVGFQWYINGIEIKGATKQFYTSPIGLIGSFSLKLITTDGKTLYTCPKVLNIPALKAQVNTFPNPVKVNENYTVQVTGLSEEQLKESELTIYNMQGICVYKSRVIESLNNINLPANGTYIGHLTTTNIDNIFKIVVVK